MEKPFNEAGVWVNEPQNDEGFRDNGSLTLTSITDVRSYENRYVADADGGNDDAFLDSLLGPITGGVTIPIDLPAQQDSISQELRINGST